MIKEESIHSKLFLYPSEFNSSSSTIPQVKFETLKFPGCHLGMKKDNISMNKRRNNTATEAGPEEQFASVMEHFQWP